MNALTAETGFESASDGIEPFADDLRIHTGQDGEIYVENPNDFAVDDHGVRYLPYSLNRK